MTRRRRRERERNKEEEEKSRLKIENQNDDSITNVDLLLFIYGVAKDDLGTELSAKFPITTLPLQTVLHLRSYLPLFLFACPLFLSHLSPSSSVFRYSCNPGRALSGGRKSISGWRQVLWGAAVSQAGGVVVEGGRRTRETR